MTSSPVHILLIDDDKDIIILIHELLSRIEGWNFKADWVNSCDRAREVIAQRRHHVYLVDYKLTDGDGINLIQEAVSDGIRAPMVVVTALGSRDLKRRALQAGAVDVLDKTELNASLLERVIAYNLERADRPDAMQQTQGGIEAQVSQRGADLLEENQHLRRDLLQVRREGKQLEHQLLRVQQLLSLTVEHHGPDVSGDHQRVAQLASAIATKMGLPRATVDSVYVGGLMHDIGNVEISHDLLCKTGTLSESELHMLRTHSTRGFRIAQDFDTPASIASMVRQHHERYDGSGYPDQLRGEDILLEARILAVADVVTSMSSARPYRPAQAEKTALDEIRHQRGRRFDPDVVDACIQVFAEKYTR